jgi:hypothetical protein
LNEYEKEKHEEGGGGGDAGGDVGAVYVGK